MYAHEIKQAHLPSAIDNQVDNDVLAEEIPVLERDLDGARNICEIDSGELPCSQCERITYPPDSRR